MKNMVRYRCALVDMGSLYFSIFDLFPMAFSIIFSSNVSDESGYITLLVTLMDDSSKIIHHIIVFLIKIWSDTDVH